jgi:hypothetical protein
LIIAVILFPLAKKVSGVLGVAILQTALIGLGLILAQVPLAAVWIVLVLIICIAQIPAMIFTVPLIISLTYKLYLSRISYE